MFPRPLVLFGVLLLASVAVIAVSGSDSLGPSLLFGHLLPNHRTHQDATTQLNSTIVTGYVDQTTDHFDSTNTATFKQRYFCNTGYANGSAIYILYVEGWGSASSSRVSDATQPQVATAKDLGATVCSLEHRYFGQSSPSPSSNAVGDMALLTSEQAVEDVSTVIAALNTKFGESAAKWVLVGASYGGSLALWHRELHPELTVGVVGSGAPINPAADFYRFQKNVEDAYNAFDPTCLTNLASGVKEVRHAIQTIAGRQNLSDALQLQPAFANRTLDYNDFQFFHAVLGAVFATPVIFNRVNFGPFSTGAGLADVCAVLNDASTANDGVSRIVNATKYLVSNVTNYAYGGLPNSYDQAVQALQAENGNDIRVTFYQMCSELGWFPTTDYGNYGVFASQVPSNLWLDMCADVFGGPAARNVTTLAAAVNVTRVYYNTSTSYNGSNALLTLGEWDPWKTLGAVACSDQAPDCSVAVVAQGAHAAESYPVSSTDSDSLTAVRQQVRDSIQRWTAATATTTSGGSKRRAGHKKHRKARKHARHQAPAASTLPEEPKIKSWSTKINYDIPDRAPRKTQTKSRFPFRPHGHRTNFNRFHDELERRVGKHGNAQGKKSSTTHNSITQSLDHFDPSVTDTWTQYFYANNASYSDGGPNFLMLGGEGPISYWDVSTDLAMGQWGQEYNAMLYSVEHRFYGQSQPFDDLSTDHLKYLTSQQALADAAVFINQINTDRNLTNPVWVVFGGSYPGNLAAWFRLKYPQLMIGSIASSAPVQAKTDYYEYLLVVENSTRAFGPDGCADNVQAFSTWLQNQTTTVAGRTAVASSFNLCGDWSADWVTEKDLEMVLSVTIDSMAGYVQYDDDAHQRLAQACGQFSSSSGSSSDSSSAGSAYYDAAEEGSPGHATISKIMQHYKEMTPEAPSKRCNDYSYADYVTYFQNIGPDDGDDAAMRGWVWQTCNEFGFFQSTDRGYNIFESAQPVNFYVDFCADVYGPQFTRDTIDANVRATNAYYGGAYAYNGTNVVFPNGSEDPWHALSVYNPINVNVTSVLIDGTSHCYDMYADDDSDTDALTAGRAQIKAILDSWLGN